MASMRSSLFATCRYSAIGATPSTSASLRMVSVSIPPLSAWSMAARSTRSLLRRGRARADRFETIFFLTAYIVRISVAAYAYKVHKIWETGMKAIVQDHYGSPEMLALRDIDKPTLGEK